MNATDRLLEKRNNVSAFIPCYNNEKTIAESIRSVQQQTYPIDEIFIVDDASSDNSVKVANEMGVHVIHNERNMGRGYTRARAFREARNELVLSCDATNALSKDFLQIAINSIVSESAGCVYGKICSLSIEGPVDKWRSRHLFKEYVDYGFGPRKVDMLITYGILMRRSCVLAVGNFNDYLRCYEDADLQKRLNRSGYKILGNPDMKVYSLVRNSILEVLERYWRWYYGGSGYMGIGAYLHAIKASIKPMMQMDIESGDWDCIPITLLCPHYCFYKSSIGSILG